MCRSCDEGQKRCKSDTSEARRRRRKNQAAMSRHTAITPNSNVTSAPPLSLTSIEEIKKESEALNVLMSQPPLENEAEQDIIDSAIELRVTALGSAIAEQAEIRANFDIKAFKEEYDTTHESFETAMETYIDVEATYEEISEALAAINESDADSETKEKILAEHKATQKAYDHAKQEYDKENSDDDIRRAEILEKQLDQLRASYVSVLSEIRDLGGKIAYTDKDADNTVRILQNTVGVMYPSDWVKSSNEANDGILIKSSPSRAHYSKSISQKEFDSNDPNVVEETEGFYIFPIDEAKAEALVASLDDNESKVYDARPLDLNGVTSRIMQVPHRTLFNPAEDTYGPDGTTPEGEGWKYGFYVNSKNGGELYPEKVWTKSKKIKKLYRPELTIDPTASENIQKATAIHEYAHRMEDVVNNKVIERQEEAWLRRRTTNATTGIREDNSPIYPVLPGSSIADVEFGRRNSFFHHYVGKEYALVRSREVLSMGAEALFGKRYGGLLGLDGSTKADSDHRAFILGIFATA